MYYLSNTIEGQKIRLKRVGQYKQLFDAVIGSHGNDVSDMDIQTTVDIKVSPTAYNEALVLFNDFVNFIVVWKDDLLVGTLVCDE